MHRIALNQPDVIQTVRLLQEAARALSVSEFPQHAIIKVDGTWHTYSEDRLEYTISKPLDPYTQKLVEHNCYQTCAVAHERRARLAEQFDAEFANIEDVDSSEDEFDVEEELADTQSPNDLLLQPSAQSNPSAISYKRKISGTSLESALKKKRKISQKNQKKAIDRVERRLHRRAGRLERMRASRQRLQEFHQEFEQSVRPRLIASLALGETWDGLGEDNVTDHAMTSAPILRIPDLTSAISESVRDQVTLKTHDIKIERQ